MTKNWHDWMKKYYPVKATALVASGKSKLELIDAAILKWEGLKPEVLEEHGLIRVIDEIGYTNDEFEPILEICWQSCTLCVAYLDKTASHPCTTCPFAQARGGKSCDDMMSDEIASPWTHWTMAEDPEPMLKWLKNAREMVAGEQNA